MKNFQNLAERLDLYVARDWFGRNLGFEDENIPKLASEEQVWKKSRVWRNKMKKTNKPPAMRVVENA